MPHGISAASTIRRSFALLLLVLLLALGLPSRTQAQGPVVLTDEQDEYPLGLHLEILEDPTRQLTIAEIAEFDQQFIPNQTPDLNLGLADSAYWIRFRIRNETSRTGEWWLEIASTDIDDVSLYFPRPDGGPGFEMKQAGNAFPTARQETSHYYTVFSLPLIPQSDSVIYLRVESRRVELPLTLWSTTGLVRETQKDFTILGLYFGTLLIMAGYNCFLFLVLRDRSYLYLVLFMASLILLEVLRRRLLQQVMWPDYVWLELARANLLAFTLSLICLLQFAASFLMTKAHAPTLHRSLVGLQIGLGMVVLLFLLSETTPFLVLCLILSLLSMGAVFLAGLVTWRQGYRPARYFVLALAAFLGALFLSIWGVLGILQTGYSEQIVQLGVVLMTLLMSLALADRIDTIRQEREQAETETRQRNRELTLLNQVIAATTSALEPESVLETTCRELVQAFDLTQGIALLANKDRTAVNVVAEYQSADQPSLLGQSIPVHDNPLLEHLVAEKAPLAVEDAQNDPRLALVHDLLRYRGAVSVLMFPILVEGEIIGGFSLGVDTPHSFSPEEIVLAQRVAEQVSSALVRAQLIDEQRRLEAQYLQAQKMEAIGRLTAGIAHDFNNMLAVTNVYAQLLQRQLTPDNPHRRLVDNILDAGRRAADLVRQLLAFSRKQVVEPKILNLNNIVTEMDKMLRRVIGENVILETRLAPDLGWITIDPIQIDQVIVNLAVNARDAMPEGGRLIIETANVVLDEHFTAEHPEAQTGEHILLSISDTGHGMSKEVKARVFEPFFTTKERGEGTGLGLATVFGIVKQSGGSISVYSEEGIGTTFKAYFPREGKPASSPSDQAEPETLLGMETILLIEDNDQVRSVTREVLQEYGYTLLEARGGQEALQLATHYAGAIHLVLTDVIMPGMSGKDAADKLTETRPDLRVLFMSGYTDNIIAHHGILDPGVHLLQKPYDADTLARKVREVLNEPMALD